MALYLGPGSAGRKNDRARAARRRVGPPRIELLETRITPSTWTGAGANSNWSTAGNWSGGVPGPGAQVVFPAGVAHKTAVNDLAANTQFGSIEVDASGYALSGNAVSVVQGLSATYTSGVSTDSIDTQIVGTVTVAGGGELDLNGAITGASGLSVSGGGTLALGGASANTYSGTTTVTGSTLTLSKSGGATAVPGALVVGDGTTAATVRETASGEIATGSGVTVNDKSTLDLNGQDNTIGTLTIAGGTVTTGAGTLTLGGDVTANDAGTEDPSTISGKLDLGGSARTFTVNEGTSADTTPDVDLSIPAVISGSTAGISFAGGGSVDLSGANTYTGTTIVTGAGTSLVVDGTIGPVQLGTGTTLGGSGTVGNVASTGGTINPGDGKGPLTTGSLTLDANSTFAPQLVGPASVAYGQVVAGGAVSLGGTLDATLAAAYTPVVGDQITIIRNNSGSAVTGTFAGLSEGSKVTIGNRPFQISYQGGSGHDVVLTAIGLPTTVAITPSSQTSTYGQMASFTATVGGQSGGQAITGSVSFYDGTPGSGTLLGTTTLNAQDQANFSTTALDVAHSPHQIYAVYGGSRVYAGSTAAQAATVTITPATVTATLVGPVLKPYDGTTAATLTAANYQLSGVAGNDIVLLNDPTSGTYDTKDVGTGKTVSVTGLSISGRDAGNYKLAQGSASGPVGIITALPLTVTGLTAHDKVYDGTTTATVDIGGASLSGVVSGDSVSLSTGGATASFADKNVGANKPVTVSGLSLSGADSGDYSLSPVTGLTASITPAPLAVTANPATMTYGNSPPALTYGVSGLKGTDTASTALSGSLATTATSKSHVGTYPIAQGTLAAVAGNYAITFKGANLSVTPAPLTITANDVTKFYGAPVPALTAGYSGFRNGDTAASLATPPTLTTSATSASPVGTYPISVGGASSPDYTITDAPGTLTVVRSGTTTALSASTTTPVVGQPVTFTVQVAPIAPGAGHPTGTVTFLAMLVDVTSPIATVPVDPATGRATFTTSAFGRGANPPILASYSGDASFAPSGSTDVQESVSAAGTATGLTVQAVRNRRGRITGVDLIAQVGVLPPGSGGPTGSVTYLRRGKPFRTATLGGGRAELTLRAGQALHQRFTARYDGDGNFAGSTSSTAAITPRALRMSARPFSAFFGRG